MSKQIPDVVYQVVDNAFNQANAKTLIGLYFGTPPSYTHVMGVESARVKSYHKNMSEYRQAREKQRQEMYLDRIRCLIYGERFPFDIINRTTREIIVPANKTLTKTYCKRMAKYFREITFSFFSPSSSALYNKIEFLRDEVRNTILD